jgi:hypothetical protein
MPLERRDASASVPNVGVIGDFVEQHADLRGLVVAAHLARCGIMLLIQHA